MGIVRHSVFRKEFHGASNSTYFIGSVTKPGSDFHASSSPDYHDVPPEPPLLSKVFVTLLPFDAELPVPVPVLPLGFSLLLATKLRHWLATVLPESPLG